LKSEGAASAKSYMINYAKALTERNQKQMFARIS